MKIKKYWKPKVDLARLGPQMFEWTKAKGDEASHVTLRGKEYDYACLIDTTHTKRDNLDKAKTSCYNWARLGWPNWTWRREGDSITAPTRVEGHRW